ncbi:MAG: DegT/DnrJ/EryC1/StrS aminotransferase family protein [Chitinophagaceae bacterium]|nr:DegT/DnrJ/EryC1/StrS aminotransferase family protein [Chitinophagaceae bacterium]
MKHTFLHEAETKKALATFILNSERLSMGAECEAFENKFALFQERKHAILFNSGGSANLAMIQALKNLEKIKQDDKAGFSAITWSTNTMPLIQLGLQSIPLDCDKQTLNLSSKILLEALKEHNFKLLFLTNVLGLTGDLDRIKEICDEKDIIILEDNCESLGSELPSGKAGNFSLASSFSFFVAHHMSTIEGGMVCTDDDSLAEMLKIVRANGWDRNLNEHQKKKWRERFDIQSAFQASYTFYDLGYNLRPTEITGFLGQYQMQFLQENIKIREQNFKKIQNAVNQNSDFFPLDFKHMNLVSGFAFPFVCKNADLRMKYIEKFNISGIEIRPLIAGNMQRQPFYQKYDKHIYQLPGADFIHDCAFYSGNYPELSVEDMQLILNCIN